MKKTKVVAFHKMYSILEENTLEKLSVCVIGSNLNMTKIYKTKYRYVNTKQ